MGGDSRPNFRGNEMNNHKKYYTDKAINTFLEEAFEIALGEDGIYKYSMKEAIEKLRYYSDTSYKYEQILEVTENE